MTTVGELPRRPCSGALAEVEDNLAALRVLEEEAKLQAAAVASAERSWRCRRIGTKAAWSRTWRC